MGKLCPIRNLNIQTIRKCLCRAWWVHEFRVWKIDTEIYQLFFKKKDSIDLGVLRITCCFSLIGLKIPWSKLRISPNLNSGFRWLGCRWPEWYSSRIGNKLFRYLKGLPLQVLWGSRTKFYRIQLLVLVDKPLCQFFQELAPQWLMSINQGLFKFEQLPFLCFRCGCLGYLC